MNTNETLDGGLEPNSVKDDKRIIYAFTIFGLLDFAAFIRGIDLLRQLLDYGSQWDLLNLGRSILIVSYLATTVLFIIRKRQALLIYFIQMPLKIVFFSLSFGFLLDLFSLPYGSIQFMIVVGIIFILEILRVLYSTMLYRK